MQLESDWGQTPLWHASCNVVEQLVNKSFLLKFANNIKCYIIFLIVVLKKIYSGNDFFKGEFIKYIHRNRCYMHVNEFIKY